MLTKKELSKELKVTEMTINRWMKKGMPHFKAPNGTVRFEIENIKEWMCSTNE